MIQSIKKCIKPLALRELWRCLLPFFIGISFTNVVFCQPFSYKFSYITVDQGLSHTDVNDIAQDARGFIWLATNFGLNRYDGYVLRRFYNDNVPVDNAFKNRIIKIFPDHEGNIWLSTEGGLQCFNPKSETFTDFSIGEKQPSPVFWKLFKPSGNLIYGFLNNTFKIFQINGSCLKEQKISLPGGIRFFDMKPDRRGVLHFSSNKGLWRLENHSSFVQIPAIGLQNQNLSRLFFDSHNNMLVTSENKVFLMSRQNLANKAQCSLIVKKQVAIPGAKLVQEILFGKNGEYWIDTHRGLARLNADLNLIQTINNKSGVNGLNSATSLSSFIDRSNCLWIGTSGGGVNYCDLNQKLFYTIQNNQGQINSLSANHIRSVLEDGNDLWIGTNANGLNLYNLKTQKFSFYNTYNAAVKLKNEEVTAMTFDNDHNLWIGGNAGIDVLRPDKKTLWKPPGYDQFPQFNISTLARDCFGNIWFGNLDNFGVLWKDQAKQYHVKIYNQGHFILPDPARPQLLVSSRQGLKRLLIDRKGNISKGFYYQASEKAGSLSSNYVTAISRQNDSTYWVGTIGGGLNRFSLNVKNDSHRFSSYGARSGVFNDVESIEIDSKGGIWMGGDGLERLDPNNGKVVRYDKNDGLQGNSFKVRASYKGADGKLYFGGINGLNYFDPQQIRPNNIKARPILTDILINNKRPVYSTEDSLQRTVSEAVGYAKEIVLNYLQNNFVISFSAMHFANPMKCRYRYKLIGFDNEWNYTDGSRPDASYSNLNYQTYNLIVEATNNDGMWSTNRAEIAIVVTPPWWKSDVAKIIYLLLIVSAIAGIYIYQARWYRLKREMEVRAVNEKKREEIHMQREELYQQQLTFFTNISHEFRTPLTLILGPLENIISQNQDVVLDNSYRLMLRNAKRLFNLISELMNFRKVADSMIKLKVEPVQINQFCLDLITEFESVAGGKYIDLQFIDHTGKHTDQPLSGLFDIHVLEKILLNLLNNSMKYTGYEGRVCLEIFTDINSFKPSFNAGFELLHDSHRAEQYLYFRVADSGIGISSETISHIFDRYYRISREHLGSGIGLALVKSLTQLHKGNIYVYSERGIGTEIIIGIPLGDENYSETEKVRSTSAPDVRLEKVDYSVLIPKTETVNKQVSEPSYAQKCILIVDDNAELGAFLRQAFEKSYFIYQAEDGKTALGIATEKVPDLIISDVMMPGMNGIELCKAVKDRFETSHIPFIILSAKDALATKIEGLESGADFYFAKPLSIDLLLLTVNNIFEQSAKLKLRFTNNYLSQATELVHSQKDKSFLQTLSNLIEDNLEDPGLDIDFLCKHLYVSRTKLYQKVKSITDQSVGDFIRTIRLKKAIQIMTHEDIPLSKVVERIGLQSSSSFSKVFKKEYGKSPLQFMQALRENPVSAADSKVG